MPTHDARNFTDLLKAHWSDGKYLCIGLDTDANRLPQDHLSGQEDVVRVVEYNREIVERTSDLVCAYKPNIAFYEALGRAGLDALARTIEIIHSEAPNVPVIIDAKRGDIGSTNLGYAASLFDELAGDAITVHPYLGRESMGPLLARPNKGVLVLARTSNDGAGEFQDLLIEGVPLYIKVAEAVANSWNIAGNCGLVAAATYPNELRRIREAVGALPILIPGIGAQGGDPKEVIEAALIPGKGGIVVNASRSILFADERDFGPAARRAALALHHALTAAADSIS